MSFGHQWRESPNVGADLLCDSYLMTAPTFTLHFHQHVSAVAVLFEDTKGHMYTTEGVGTNHYFGAGHLHWTLAGSGVQHTQTPTKNSKIYAVKLFIDLLEVLRHTHAQTFHLKAEEVPIYEKNDSKVRVLVGKAFGLKSPLMVPQDILIVDGWSKSDITIPVPLDWKIWIYDRDNQLAGYTKESVVKGRFLMGASPSFTK
ncbi:MAG: hypothetical protein KGN31_06935 [Betaproteobacteria bacterium]|nr:hypothetical protein [Betaproteobacteria bacterium]